MSTSGNNLQSIPRQEHIFIVNPVGDHDALQCFSNRQLVFRWIQDNRNVFLKQKSAPPRQIKSYEALCRYWSAKWILQVIVLDAGQPKEYELIKAPVINK